ASGGNSREQRLSFEAWTSSTVARSPAWSTRSSSIRSDRRGPRARRAGAVDEPVVEHRDRRALGAELDGRALAAHAGGDIERTLDPVFVVSELERSDGLFVRDHLHPRPRRPVEPDDAVRGDARGQVRRETLDGALRAPAVDHGRAVGRDAFVGGLFAVARAEELVIVVSFALEVRDVDRVDDARASREAPGPFAASELRP